MSARRTLAAVGVGLALILGGVAASTAAMSTVADSSWGIAPSDGTSVQPAPTSSPVDVVPLDSSWG